MRIGAEIADPGVDVQLSVRRNPDDSVETGESGRVIRLPDTETADLAAVTLTAASSPGGPVELGRCLLECFFQIAARDRRLIAAEECVARRRIDPANVERRQPEPLPEPPELSPCYVVVLRPMAGWLDRRVADHDDELSAS